MVFFCLHTIASRDFHAKVRALSSWVHKLKDVCYLSVLEEAQIKLWPLKIFGVFTAEPSEGQIRLTMEPPLVEGFDLYSRIFVEDTRVLIFRALHIPAASPMPVHQPLLAVSLRLWAIIIFHTWLVHRQWSAEAAEQQRKGLSAIMALIQMHPYMWSYWYAHIYLCIHISGKTYLPFRYAHIL